mgnify:FL=1
MKNLSGVESKFVYGIFCAYKLFNRCIDSHPYAILFLSACTYGTTAYGIKAEWNLAQSYAYGVIFFASCVGLVLGSMASISRFGEVSSVHCKK